MKHKFSVLVVDDDEHLRLALRQCLEDMHCHVLLATDGLAALEILKTHTVAMVLTDIQMPGMDGVSLLESINKRNLDIPVVVMSGHANYDDQDIDDRDGGIFLEKPVSREQLAEIIALYKPTENAS